MSSQQRKNISRPQISLPALPFLAALVLTGQLSAPARAQPAALSGVEAEEIDAPSAPALPPPDYGTLPAPKNEGDVLVDPVFSTPIRRLTQAKKHGVALMSHDYARSSSLNDDDSLVLIHAAGQYSVFTAEGRKMADLPGVAGKFAEPRWQHGNKWGIVYLNKNRVMGMDVRSLQSEVLYEFPEYSLIYSGEEQELSEDGQHYALIGKQGGKDAEAFVLNLATGNTGPRLDLRHVNRPVNWVAVSPDNELVIGWDRPFGTGRYQGVELYDQNMNFKHQLATWMSHGDLCRNAAGETLYVQSNAASPNPYRNEHWIVAHPLDGRGDIPLQRLDWEQVPHISCNRPGGSQWALVSLYLPSNPSAAKFAPFDNEVFQLALDGSQRTRRVLHHRSRPIGGSYFYESRASESRSGRYVVFSSNFGRSDTGSSDYTDAYLAPLPRSPGELENGGPGIWNGGQVELPGDWAENRDLDGDEDAGGSEKDALNAPPKTDSASGSSGSDDDHPVLLPRNSKGKEGPVRLLLKGRGSASRQSGEKSQIGKRAWSCTSAAPSTSTLAAASSSGAKDSEGKVEGGVIPAGDPASGAGSQLLLGATLLLGSIRTRRRGR